MKHYFVRIPGDPLVEGDSVVRLNPVRKPEFGAADSSAYNYYAMNEVDFVLCRLTYDHCEGMELEEEGLTQHYSKYIVEGLKQYRLKEMS